MTVDADREAILALHKDWWEANHRLVIPQMRSVYPSGDSYLMFNANGHPYFGIEEKTKLWEWYAGQIDIAAYPEAQIMRLSISGDMAWLACEVAVALRAVGEQGTGSATWEIKDLPRNHVRATEIYQRDDGDGNPVWKMWHFHASPLPDPDEQRPALGGTLTSRGLGGGGAQPPMRVTRDGTRD